jgi:hypothetical protein
MTKFLKIQKALLLSALRHSHIKNNFDAYWCSGDDIFNESRTYKLICDIVGFDINNADNDFKWAHTIEKGYVDEVINYNIQKLLSHTYLRESDPKTYLFFTHDKEISSHELADNITIRVLTPEQFNEQLDQFAIIETIPKTNYEPSISSHEDLSTALLALEKGSYIHNKAETLTSNESLHFVAMRIN